MVTNINAIIHTDIEPGVITTEMIRNAFQQQGPTGEAGRLMEEEEYDIHTTSVKSLGLEFLNILRIDHLWMLTGLTKLKLSNNIIEKIENLNELVNLIELDLSFNRIHEMENLNSLVNLEILSLFQNKISEIKNIDTLKKLEIFTIGNNRISDNKCVQYIRKFKALKSLNMAGNPCANDEGFREYVAAFVPQLVYYEYKLITQPERENARNTHIRELFLLENEEAKLLKEEQLAAANEEKLLLHKEAYVEHLDKEQLYDSLFENDPDGQAALLTGQEAEEIFEGFKTKICQGTEKLFKVGMEQLKLRQEEIQQFTNTINETKTTSIKNSRSVVEDFLKKRDRLFYETKHLVDAVETQQLNDDQLNEFAETMRNNSDKLLNLCQEVWHTLMGNEMTLLDQIEELNTSFERNLGDMINTFIETAQGYFTQLREHESSFMELIIEHLLRHQAQVTLRNDDLSTAPTALRNMMVDKDAVHSAMAASHDIHLLAIDAREDLLISRIREWHSKLATDLQNDEIKRNRRAVSEINHFIDFQREEFEQLHTKLSETYLQVNDNLIEGQSLNSESGPDASVSGEEEESVASSSPGSLLSITKK